eukprot:CAMPEP_0176032982 /NCGR_PEP_ID=MMETSP0120_2-20121206/16286_1 /TAXON_ID=160619 /ORGANISM="Kryptoperidinium foliaceum, Strain CCMP 1326" /LENGTH=315 /DNA_ID=CAMNT_0017366305 /DNA_START=1 /DNA_END=948 /DNA_ORIENTATION=-
MRRLPWDRVAAVAMASRRCPASRAFCAATSAFLAARAPAPAVAARRAHAPHARLAEVTAAMRLEEPSWTKPWTTMGREYRGDGLPEGLRYCRDFISEEEHEEVLAVLDGGRWLHYLKSRAQQFFGLVYYHTTHLHGQLQPSDDKAQQGRALDELPEWLLPRVVATGVFGDATEVNQVAANEYLGKAGISPHIEDIECFGASLATLSLVNPVELTLSPAAQQRSMNGTDHGNWVKVLLEPRSLLVLQGASRYAFRHGIRRSRTFTLPDGHVVQRGKDYRRVSLTFRELLPTRRMLNRSAQDIVQHTWARRQREIPH